MQRCLISSIEEQWPDYLALAWRDVKSVVGTPEYAAATQQLSQLAAQGVDRFVAPGAPAREAARRAGVPEDQIDNLGAVVRLFADLLPGLILNVALFYRAIA